MHNGFEIEIFNLLKFENFENYITHFLLKTSPKYFNIIFEYH